MPDASLRLAYFARGLDGLFLPQVPGCEAFGLLRADSPEEAWAGRFVPRERALLYRVLGHADDPYPSTGDVLRSSDVARVLARKRLGALLLSSAFDSRIRKWGRENSVRILAADYEQGRRLENKLWFDRFLARHRIPRPPSGVVVACKRTARALRFGDGPVVVQGADSQGGEGTFFLDSLEQWPAFSEHLQLPRGQRLLARRFIRGRPLGITLFVAPGLVALSAVRLQCYYPAPEGEIRRLFAGVQWLPTRELPDRLQQRIAAVFHRLGALLYRRRFFGVANLDFLADENDGVWVIECNPRMSAATPQLLANLELSGGFPVGRRLIEGFMQSTRWPRHFEAWPLPQSDFAGATLDITAQDSARQVVLREHTSRALRLPDGSATLFSLAARGHSATPETTLGMILADCRLYDAAGKFNAVGRRLCARIRYT